MNKYMLSENYDSFPSAAPPFNIWPVSEFERQFDLLEKLGEGKFGEVFKVVHRKSRRMQAAKLLHCSRASQKLKVRDEMDLLSELDHPNVLRLVAAYEDQESFIQVFELLSGGQLFDRIVHGAGDLTEADVAKMLHQICQGCSYLAQKRIAHLDLKPENVVCVSKHNFLLKIIDFGFARRLPPDDPSSPSPAAPVFSTEGTPEFASPEVINYQPVTLNTDMWSVGVLTYVLLSGLSPFLGEDKEETLDNVLAAEYRLDEPEFDPVSAEGKDFIRRLLVTDPADRMSADAALEHPWITDLTRSSVIGEDEEEEEEQAQQASRRRKTSYDRVRLRGFVSRGHWSKCTNVIAACAKMRREAEQTGKLALL